jgi:deoxyribose-phosphate aldolase
MTAEELAGYIDHTLLRPDITEAELKAFLEEARSQPFASVCIPPSYVELAADILKGSPLKVGTVIGFPLGYNLAKIKELEAMEAVNSGADEIDMVINISALKSGNLTEVRDEISAVASAIKGRTLKVIIETCYLTAGEKLAACDAVIDSAADFVKTSTGFGPAGARVEDIALLYKRASGRIGVKASGGIGSLDDALKMIEAGASRLGSSSGIKILEEYRKSL